DAFNLLAGKSAQDMIEVEMQNVMEFDTLPGHENNGGSSGDGNGGPGKGNKSESTKNNKQKTEQKIIESIKLMKAVDLVLNINQNNSFFANKFAGNVFYKYGVPVIEIAGNLYRLSYSKELKNGYTTTEFVYDTTGTVTGFVIGAEVGGLYGAITGVLIGVTFDSTKAAYKTVKPGFMSGYNNFINSAIGNWMKYN